MTNIAKTDNRWSPRQHVNLDITLHVPGQFPFSGVIRNVSLGGLFVETDTTRLDGDSEVYLSFTILYKSGIHKHRVPARSNRLNGNGVAFEFSTHDAEVSHSLRQLLYPAPELVVTTAPHNASLLSPAG